MSIRNKTKVLRSPNRSIKRIENINLSMRKGNDDVRVGLPKGSNDYPDGTSVIMVAAVHEFGSHSRNVPQRSYLRSTLISNRRKYKNIFRRLSKKIVQGKINKEEALNILGLLLQTDIRQKITDINSPPLKSREGNPLVDTGHLRQSIIYKVDN